MAHRGLLISTLKQASAMSLQALLSILVHLRMLTAGGKTDAFISRLSRITKTTAATRKPLGIAVPEKATKTTTRTSSRPTQTTANPLRMRNFKFRTWTQSDSVFSRGEFHGPYGVPGKFRVRDP